ELHDQEGGSLPIQPSVPGRRRRTGWNPLQIRRPGHGSLSVATRRHDVRWTAPRSLQRTCPKEIAGHGGLIVIGTWKGRGLVLLAAAPLLGLAPIGAGAHADEGGVVLRTAAPKNDVLPGAAYTWAYTVTAKGPAKS